MILDTQLKVIKARLRAMFSAILTTILIVLVLLTGWFDKPVLGVSKSIYIIIIVSAYLFITIYFSLKNNYYIFFSTEKNKLIIRYYSLKLFNNSKRSIEIPLESFYNYKIENSRAGLVKNLIIYQKTNKGVAKYQPISISILSDKETTQIINTLNRYKRK